MLFTAANYPAARRLPNPVSRSYSGMGAVREPCWMRELYGYGSWPRSSCPDAGMGLIPAAMVAVPKITILVGGLVGGYIAGGIAQLIPAGISWVEEKYGNWQRFQDQFTRKLSIDPWTMITRDRVQKEAYRLGYTLSSVELPVAGSWSYLAGLWDKKRGASPAVGAPTQKDVALIEQVRRAARAPLSNQGINDPATIAIRGGAEKIREWIDESGKGAQEIAETFFEKYWPFLAAAGVGFLVWKKWGETK